MPQIKIKEVDRTNAIAGEYQNFAVVVPGAVADGKDLSIFDDNGIYECFSQTDFKNNIGLVPPITSGEGEEEKIIQMGNQIAYELLGLGYPILYKKLNESETENGTEVDCLGTDDFWEPLKDKATYDFRFIINGLLTDGSNGTLMANANKEIAKIAIYDNDAESTLDTGRGDCIALVDVDESIYNTIENRASRLKLYQAIRDEINSDHYSFIAETKSKYVAIFAPSVCLLGLSNTDEFNDNHKFPASFYYLACFKQALDNGFAEWYAAAGYTRGVCKYTVESTDVNFGEYLINALEPRTDDKLKADLPNAKGIKAAVNVIAKIRNNYYMWGNRTAEQLRNDDLIASHFLNIRHLCSSLKKQIYVACRRFTFDPNSDVLWINFCNAIKPILEKMKADQGLKDYAIEKLAGRKAELKARIRIIPIEAVEDFDIEISLEDNFGETTATAVEK